MKAYDVRSVRGQDISLDLNHSYWEERYHSRPEYYRKRSRDYGILHKEGRKISIRKTHRKQKALKLINKRRSQMKQTLLGSGEQ